MAAFGYRHHSRHVVQGTWRMCASVTTGVVLGAASLVIAPITGLKASGVPGLITGVGMGAMGSVLLPVC